MNVMHYRIEPPYDVPDEEPATGIIKNAMGAWLGRWTLGTDALDTEIMEYVELYEDAQGEPIPAPDGWRARIVDEQAYFEMEETAQ